MKSALKLTNADISYIIGNTADSVKSTTQPNKDLPRFTDKNNIPSEQIEESKLVNQLVKDGNASIVERDVVGNYHFNGVTICDAYNALPRCVSYFGRFN